MLRVNPEKARAARARAVARQIKKQSDPQYRAAQLEKKKAAQTRAALRLQQKQSDPIYQQKQREKKIDQQLRAKERRKASASKPKATSMKGRSRNNAEMSLHNQMAQLGCICCINAGLALVGVGQLVSIHHCNGRVSKSSHEESIPLCQWHHDVPLPKELQKNYPNVFPIHAKGSVGGKCAWESVNGSQNELILQVWKLLGYSPKHSLLAKA